MNTKAVAAFVATMLLLSVAIPVLAEIDFMDGQDDEEVEIAPIKDIYLEEYLPCTNARYRAWFGAS